MVSFVPQESLDEIAGRIDLASFISEHVPLKKSGKDYKGLCPFHQEKTPSFMVSPEKQVFYCFGCGQGGNLYSFLMKIENIGFMEAVTRLALRAGVDISRFGKSGEKREDREIFYKINRYAAWYFSDQLKKPSGRACLAYVQKRGIETSTCDEFSLGYAPDCWDGLTRFLSDKKVPLGEAEKLGLVRKKKDGGYYDFFRNRLVFPIMDYDSRISGFGGRRLSDGGDETGAKYINSPESPVYHKGSLVYGLSQAKKAIRDSGEVTIVEGYLDLIALFQAGIRNVAAPLGTALTEAQVHLLSRFAKNFILMFDGDEAGKSAALRTLGIFFASGHHPRLAVLPAGEDPDTAVRKKGGEWVKSLVTRSSPAVEWIMLENLSHAGSRTSRRVEAVKNILPYIQALPSDLEQKSYMARLAHFLGLGESAMSDLVRSRTAEKKGGVPPSGRSKISLERILLQLYVRYPKLCVELLDAGVFEQFEDDRVRELGLRLAGLFKKTGNLPLGAVLGPESNLDENFISGLAFDPEGSQTVEPLKIITDCMQQWRHQRMKNRLKELTGEIHLAEIRNDATLLKSLIKQKSETIKSLKAIRQA